MRINLKPLIAEMEAADCGSRELDVKIWDAVEAWPKSDAGWRRAPNGAEVYAPTFAPSYTTSVDRALTLVPSEARIREWGQWWNIDRPGGWFCNVMRWELNHRLEWAERAYVYGFAEDDRMPKLAPSAAMALCIACLKARDASP